MNSRTVALRRRFTRRRIRRRTSGSTRGSPAPGPADTCTLAGTATPTLLDGRRGEAWLASQAELVVHLLIQPAQTRHQVRDLSRLPLVREQHALDVTDDPRRGLGRESRHRMLERLQERVEV